MSDPKSSYGDPVEEPRDADADVVTRAQEALAEAEAARRDAVTPEEAAAADAPGTDGPATVVEKTTVVETPQTADGDDADESRWDMYLASADPEPGDDRGDADRTARTTVLPPEPVAAPAPADETPTVVAAPVVAAAPAAAPAPAAAAPVAAAPVTPSEPVAESNPAVFSSNQQPIFVQAPEAPRPRGNRGAAGAIGLLAALAFAVLFLAATLAFEIIFGAFGFDEIVDGALAVLTTWAFWVPVAVFYLAFWFLGAIINRGGWAHWVIWGILVGVAAYAGYLLGQLFQAPFWMLTAREGGELIEASLLSPLAIVAFVLGRELTIWFGAWVARRGKRVTELNDEAQREYERTLEAGPQLHRV